MPPLPLREFRGILGKDMADALAARGAKVARVARSAERYRTDVRDPEQVESPVDEMAGLGLLPVETTFAASKATHQARARLLGGPGWLGGLAGRSVEGYACAR